MEIYTALIGSYPRPIRIAKTITRFRSGKIEEDKVLDEINKFQRDFFNLMAEYKVDYVTDGMVEWDDIADLTYSFLKGVEKGALDRFFDNNFYYRHLVVKSKLEYRDSNDYIKYIELARKNVEKNQKLKAVILGPLSFSYMSKNVYYKGKTEELMKDYSVIVNLLLKDTEKYYDAIEIHEPYIFQDRVRRQRLENIREYYNIMLNGISKEKHIITYFNIKFDVLEEYFKIPVEVYGFDVTEDNKPMIGMLYNATLGKNVYFGVLDSRNTKLDKISTIRRIINNAKEKGISKLLLGNSTFNDLIPELIVKRKFKILQRAKEMILNE
ncbi:5-methyltetrahydropteroyltriglutamate--homocysteine methyltransferase [Stygiolobus caldivivus]|uniref:5-methyltetrahydropteroyltriglutamate--homocysteine methyltransferase n=1 Tax=Stygiolobus caldivivus TaxID=2824673 RepID=A0A8D5U8H7_9CREN|nr:5-methyltetrahydropteroyltriglutamate--homocysteine methyltransferase [Stygiolobus caldivivus]BCU70689.1 5-methyltetrahydropteroyltriglutamate--homocysteine methyltransferase [Stygiolobus caldivivus]